MRCRWNNLERKRNAAKQDEEDVDFGGNASLQRNRKLNSRKKDESQAKLDYAHAALKHLTDEVASVTTKQKRASRSLPGPSLAAQVAAFEDDNDLDTPQSSQTIISEDVFEVENDSNADMEHQYTIIETKDHFGVFWLHRDIEIKVKGRKKPTGDFLLDVEIKKKKITMECFENVVTTQVDFLTPEFKKEVANLKDSTPITFQLAMPPDINLKQHQTVNTFDMYGIVFERLPNEGSDVLFTFE